MNTLYLGDCLYVLRENIPDESVDLIYIDPPFNSKRDYNIFFDDKEIQSQRIAFEDTWTLKNIQDSLVELHTMKTEYLYYLLLTYQKVAPHAFPYLTMMSLRLVELHRVLKPTGSFYLHCDPTMSHYLKTVCDIIFSKENYRTEITWMRTSAHSDAKSFANVSDIILFYSKSDEFTFETQYQPYSEDYIEKYYKHREENGKVFLDRDLTAGGLSGGGYEYVWKGVKRIWRCPEETMEKYEREKRLYYTNKGTPRLKQYLDDMPGVPLTSIWIDIRQSILKHKNVSAIQHKSQKHS